MEGVKESVRAIAILGRQSPRRSAGSTAIDPFRLHDPLQYAECLEWIYDRLADRHSRDQMVSLVGASICGPTLQPPDTRPASQRRSASAIDDAFLVSRRILGSTFPDVHLYRVPGTHGPIDIRARRDDLFNTFMVERFAYHHDGVDIRAQAGHVVIDGGSRYGDTTLYFADRVGLSGEVHAIEPDVRNVTIIRENCSANPLLGYQTIVTVGALSDQAGDWVSYEADGPLSLILRPDRWGHPVAQAPTVSIDELISREMIARIDFIKVDVPDAERALRGARETIRTHRPTLAIALRHRADDLISIQPHLLEIADTYDFYLDHAAADGAGAVVFARPHVPQPRG